MIKIVNISAILQKLLVAMVNEMIDVIVVDSLGDALFVKKNSIIDAYEFINTFKDLEYYEIRMENNEIIDCRESE